MEECLREYVSGLRLGFEAEGQSEIKDRILTVGWLLAKVS